MAEKNRDNLTKVRFDALISINKLFLTTVLLRLLDSRSFAVIHFHYLIPSQLALRYI